MIIECTPCKPMHGILQNTLSVVKKVGKNTAKRKLERLHNCNSKLKNDKSVKKKLQLELTLSIF